MDAEREATKRGDAAPALGNEEEPDPTQLQGMDTQVQALGKSVDDQLTGLKTQNAAAVQGVQAQIGTTTKPIELAADALRASLMASLAGIRKQVEGAG